MSINEDESLTIYLTEVTVLRGRNSEFSWVFGIILLVAATIILISASQYFQPKQPIEVVWSLDPSTIKENERSKLTLTFNNLDLKTHEIQVFFGTSPRISIYEGNEHLLQQNTYTFTLEASDPSEQRVFTLRGTLEAGTLSSQYLIPYSVCVDGKELPKNWDEPVLTIQRS